jgi:hypothetical protein
MSIRYVHKKLTLNGKRLSLAGTMHAFDQADPLASFPPAFQRPPLYTQQSCCLSSYPFCSRQLPAHPPSKLSFVDEFLGNATSPNKLVLDLIGNIADRTGGVGFR